MKRKRTGSGVTKSSKKRPRIQRGATTGYVARTPGVKAITETKYFDAEFGQSAILATTTTWAGTEVDPATGNCLFFPAVGNAYNNREGRKTHVKKIKINGWIIVPAQQNQTATDHSTNVRLIVYQDKQSNATQSQGEDLMASGANSLPTMMFQNPANFGRFKVLKDKTFAFQNPAVSYDGTNMEQQSLMRTFKISIKFRKPVTINYNNTNGATVADVVDNSFHMIAATSGAGLAPELAYKVRTVFCE